MSGADDGAITLGIESACAAWRATRRPKRCAAWSTLCSPRHGRGSATSVADGNRRGRVVFDEENPMTATDALAAARVALVAALFAVETVAAGDGRRGGGYRGRFP